MLQPTHKNATMSTTVAITQDQSTICLDMTYYAYPNMTTKQLIAVKIERLDNQTGAAEKLFYFYAHKILKIEWARKRLETAELEAGNYSISIFIESRSFYIGAIDLCKKRKYLTQKVTMNTSEYITKIKSHSSICVYDSSL